MNLDYMAVLKGWRNAVYYGGKVRFVHSLVMMILFKPLNKNNLKQLFKLTFEHANNLGKFVLIYKLLVQILNKYISPTLTNTFIAGTVGGVIAFGNKTPVSYQLFLYFLSRNFGGIMEEIHRRLWSHLSAKQRKEMVTNFFYPLFASVVWGLVMFLFEYERSVLQQSMVSSMKFIYKESDEPLNDWEGNCAFIHTQIWLNPLFIHNDVILVYL